MTQSTLITASNSILLAVDIQEELLPAIHNHVSLLHRTTVLLDVARKLDIPRVFSEHCVDKIGPIILISNFNRWRTSYADKNEF
ncbi:cysteine hydrolase family protein [Veronia nyctiphanis]|uniref:hypothetical protein n=1 Tax=Veronia nyctiphanis TaxID=1278244 RepID=UPI00100A9762|nr:hypothetical protein [Veronia nyctiphanis]